MVVTSN
jgi:hypothetical protein